MENKKTEQIACDLVEQVPSDKAAFIAVVDKESSEASISVKDMNDMFLLATLIHIYKVISPPGRGFAKIAIKNIDGETSKAESEPMAKINLN